MSSIELHCLPQVFNGHPTKSSFLLTTLRSKGCFLLRDCIEPLQLDAVHKAMHELFSLSLHKKKRYAADKPSNPLDAGFSPYGIAKALDTGVPNLLETWDIGDPINRWPQSLSDEYTLIDHYQKILYKNAVASLEYISHSIGLSSELIELVEEKNGGIHLIHYFLVPQDAPPSARRQSEHSDNTLITLIPPPFPLRYGLSIFDREERAWYDVTIPKDACLVQVGLLLEYITAGELRANIHTVHTPAPESPQNTPRYSTPFFVSPEQNRAVCVLPSYRRQNANIQYPDTTVGALQDRYFAPIFVRS